MAKAKTQEPIRPQDAPKDIPYYNEIPTLAGADLEKIVLARQKAQAEMERLGAEVKEFSAQIVHLMRVANISSVGVSSYRVTRCEGRITRTLTGAALLGEKVDPAKIAQAALKIDRDALIGLGVPVTTIKRATVEQQGEEYVMVSDSRKKRGGDA